MKKNFLKIRMPMLIANIVIFISMVIGLSFAIRESSTERMIGSSIGLMLSSISIIVFLLTSKSKTNTNSKWINLKD